MFNTSPATEAGLRSVRNTLALRRMAADAPPLGVEEKLRFLRAWLTSLATCFARVFEPLASRDAPPCLQQLMLDRLAQPQFWVAALTIATRQHAQLLRLSANTVELEAGAESLATGELLGLLVPFFLLQANLQRPSSHASRPACHAALCTQWAPAPVRLCRVSALAWHAASVASWQGAAVSRSRL